MGFGKLDKTPFRVALLEYELGGLRYIGQIRLGGSLANSCILTECLMNRLSLERQRRGFTSSISVSSTITHWHVILCLHSSSLLFQLSYYCCVILIMAQSSLFVYPLTFTLFHNQLSQSKINQVITLIWWSKWLLCFHTFSSFQLVSKLLWFNYLSVILGPSVMD